MSFRYFIQRTTRWWFQRFFISTYLGKWSNLTNIFQMGWNHQLDYDDITWDAPTTSNSGIFLAFFWLMLWGFGSNQRSVLLPGKNKIELVRMKMDTQPNNGNRQNTIHPPPSNSGIFFPLSPLLQHVHCFAACQLTCTYHKMVSENREVKILETALYSEGPQFQGSTISSMGEDWNCGPSLYSAVSNIFTSRFSLTILWYVHVSWHAAKQWTCCNKGESGKKKMKVQVVMPGRLKCSVIVVKKMHPGRGFASQYVILGDYDIYLELQNQPVFEWIFGQTTIHFLW